jgi:uncharacterized LabA/DUF88 family protein
MEILYVDGANLEGTLKAFSETYGVDTTRFDYGTFFGNVGGAARIFYYDSWPVKKGEESESNFEERLEAKERLFHRMQRIDRLFLQDGTTKWSKRRGVEQKGVDILLAVDVISHALKGVCSVASILTSDLDFYPVLKALRETQVRSRLVFDPSCSSRELLVEADEILPLWPHLISRGLGGQDQELFSGSAIEHAEMSPDERAVAGVIQRGGTEYGLWQGEDGHYAVYANTARYRGRTPEDALNRVIASGGYAYWLLQELKADWRSRQPARK